METTRIHLGGALGTLFGEEWNLFVSSPQEALRAIDINTKGEFFRYLGKDGHNQFYSIGLGKQDRLLDKTELSHRSGTADIFILPTIKGANSGVGKIIAGAVLIIIGVVLTIYGYGTVGEPLIGAGLSMVIGGIVQLLTPVPKQNPQLQSYGFAGNSTAVQQGSCVPIVYGRALVTPVPVCVSFDSADLYATQNTQRGTVDSIALIGGGYQYVGGDSVAAISPTISS